MINLLIAYVRDSSLTYSFTNIWTSCRINDISAEEVEIVKENENILRNEERISVGAFLEEGIIEKYPSSIMKVPRGYPAPEWFFDLLGTRQRHGNVKFLITPALQTMLGHHADYVITHYQCGPT